MSIYAELQPIATELFKEFAQGVVQYVRVTPGAGSVDNPGNPTETPFTIDAAVRGVQFRYVQNGLAVASDLQINTAAHPALVADFDATAKIMKGFAIIDGVRYKIVQAIAKPSAGTPVAFSLIVRKGE